MSTSIAPSGAPAARAPVPHAVRAVILAVLALLLAMPLTARAQDGRVGRDANYTEFYEALEPYGRWIAHRDFGYVWLPDAADDSDWRPYTRGHWARSEDYGWIWVSDEPFGWATYHYGRWRLDPELGWFWIPGRDWAPAWVAWRQSDDYIGWAPLPPDAVWMPDAERIDYRSDFFGEAAYDPYWIFVHPRFLISSLLYRYCVPVNRNRPIVRSSSFVSNFGYRDHRVYNRGIDYRAIEQRTHRPIPLLRVTAVDSLRPGSPPRGASGGVISIYRPKLSSSAPVAPRTFLPPDARPRQDGSGGRARGPGAGSSRPTPTTAPAVTTPPAMPRGGASPPSGSHPQPDTRSRPSPTTTTPPPVSHPTPSTTAPSRQPPPVTSTPPAAKQPPAPPKQPAAVTPPPAHKPPPPSAPPQRPAPVNAPPRAPTPSHPPAQSPPPKQAPAQSKPADKAPPKGQQPGEQPK